MLAGKLGECFIKCVSLKKLLTLNLTNGKKEIRLRSI
jgi:hypothetical protein